MMKPTSPHLGLWLQRFIDMPHCQVKKFILISSVNEWMATIIDLFYCKNRAALVNVCWTASLLPIQWIGFAMRIAVVNKALYSTLSNKVNIWVKDCVDHVSCIGWTQNTNERTKHHPHHTGSGSWTCAQKRNYYWFLGTLPPEAQPYQYIDAHKAAAALPLCLSVHHIIFRGSCGAGGWIYSFYIL